MDINSFVIGHSKGYNKGYSTGKNLAGVVSVEENEAGGTTYELKADESGVKLTTVDEFFTGAANVQLPTATSIPSYAFVGNSNIVNVYMPRVTTIGYQSFSNCSLLTQRPLLNALNWN